MTRLPFIVTHDGQSARCHLVVDAQTRVKLIEMADVSTCADLVMPLSEKIEMLNDLIHAEMPFDALASCRRSPGLFGAILDPAATELENFRAALGASARAGATHDKRGENAAGA